VQTNFTGLVKQGMQFFRLKVPKEPMSALDQKQTRSNWETLRIEWPVSGQSGQWVTRPAHAEPKSWRLVSVWRDIDVVGT